MLELNHVHDWDVSVPEAIQIQKRLASSVEEIPLEWTPRTIAGVDVSFHRTDYKQYDARCGIAVLSFPELEVLEKIRWEGHITFPYVPGLLSFREIPAVLEALEKSTIRPDVIMTDGQGRAHPRRFGLACHLGVLLDLPVFGVAKKRLIGTHPDVGLIKGSSAPLIDRDEIIGMVVRTRSAVKPVFVSVGHRVTLEDAVRLTLASTSRYRIPEPTRLAHQVSRSIT